MRVAGEDGRQEIAVADLDAHLCGVLDDDGNLLRAPDERPRRLQATMDTQRVPCDLCAWVRTRAEPDPAGLRRRDLSHRREGTRRHILLSLLRHRYHYHGKILSGRYLRDMTIIVA